MKYHIIATLLVFLVLLGRKDSTDSHYAADDCRCELKGQEHLRVQNILLLENSAFSAKGDKIASFPNS